MKITYDSLGEILYNIASDEGKTDYTVEDFVEWLQEQDRHIHLKEVE
ncbi:hypothetical protein [Pseudobacillus badius]|nr:hypothetical protein [Bacillus badius]GLY11363.1 hypothetical protein Bbad01_25790 [Bacillus badius]